MVKRTLPMASSSEAIHRQHMSPRSIIGIKLTRVKSRLQNRNTVILPSHQSKLLTLLARAIIPSTCAARSSFQHYQDRGREAWRACSADQATTGRRRLSSNCQSRVSLRARVEGHVHQLTIHMLGDLLVYALSCECVGCCFVAVVTREERR